MTTTDREKLITNKKSNLKQPQPTGGGGASTQPANSIANKSSTIITTSPGQTTPAIAHTTPPTGSQAASSTTLEKSVAPSSSTSPQKSVQLAETEQQQATATAVNSNGDLIEEVEMTKEAPAAENDDRIARIEVTGGGEDEKRTRGGSNASSSSTVDARINIINPKQSVIDHRLSVASVSSVQSTGSCKGSPSGVAAPIAFSSSTTSNQQQKVAAQSKK